MFEKSSQQPASAVLLGYVTPDLFHWIAESVSPPNQYILDYTKKMNARLDTTVENTQLSV